MKAVIVAAGPGSRLRPATLAMPKPLLSVSGKPLLVRTLETLVCCSIEEAIIVTGYLAGALTKGLRKWQEKLEGIRINFIHNGEYERGNGTSLLRASRIITSSEQFLLLMSDHIVGSDILKSLLAGPEREFTLCVDRELRLIQQLGDATKVLINEQGYLADIGKELAEWNGVDTGVFLCEPVVFEAGRELVKQSYTVSITDCMRWLISRGCGIRAKDVSGSLWFDIDTPEDLEFAENFLSRGGLENAPEMGWDCITVP